MNNLVQLKDGEENTPPTETKIVNVEVVDNGYIINTTCDEGDQKLVYSYDQRKEMMKYLGGILGV